MIKTQIKSNLEEYERLFLSLGDKTRLRLLSLMSNGEVSVGHLVDEIGESQPKVSRHLAYLRNSGVVNTRRDGKWIYYGIQPSDDPDVDRVVRFIIETLSGSAPVESTEIKRALRNKAQTKSSAKQVQKADVETHSHQQEQEQQLEHEAEMVEYVYQEESEEIFADNETDDNELEVFLL
jgi:ArsR family transcriptional regulator, arsenate/arsenite/antimonite-responsive transcriptional repressor